MDFLLEHWCKFWNFIKDSENGGGITVLLLILGSAWALITKPWAWFKKNKQQPVPQVANLPVPTDQPIIVQTVKQNEDDTAKKIAEAEEQLKTAHDEEKALLRLQIEELRKRAANPEQALQEARATIAKLKDDLTRESNSIGADRMEEARQALEAGDFSIADTLFAEIEDQEMLAVERTAHAAFARGNIAKQDIRWADAAQHYARAARLHPNYEHLHTAREFAWRSGDYDKAIILGKDLLKIAKTEYGETNDKFATALNEHATSLDATGKYEQAEPLYKQALEIGKQTIGEAHPTYATRLNNLAALYKTTGKYEQAEPLYLQALEIFKQTIGETHPDYAAGLNNLAGLYEATGKYKLAEPLYKQALEIGKQTIGETHPNYAASLNNLALLYETTKKYEQAEPLYQQAMQILEATLGPGHPNTIGCKENYETLLKTWEK